MSFKLLCSCRTFEDLERINLTPIVGENNFCIEGFAGEVTLEQIRLIIRLICERGLEEKAILLMLHYKILQGKYVSVGSPDAGAVFQVAAKNLPAATPEAAAPKQDAGDSKESIEKKTAWAANDEKPLRLSDELYKFSCACLKDNSLSYYLKIHDLISDPALGSSGFNFIISQIFEVFNIPDHLEIWVRADFVGSSGHKKLIEKKKLYAFFEELNPKGWRELAEKLKIDIKKPEPKKESDTSAIAFGWI